MLTRFWLTLKEILGKYNRIVTLERLSEELMAVFEWRDTPEIKLLGALIELNPAFGVDREAAVLFHPDLPCIACRIVRDNLNVLIREEADELPVSDVGILLAESCTKECPQNIKVPTRFGASFVEYLTHFEDKIKIENEIVLSQMKWLLKYGEMLKTVVYAALETLGRPLHYTDLAAYIRKSNKRFRSIKDQNVHSCLCKYDIFQLTGRGIYGLSSWDLKPYKSHSEAIVELLEKRGSAVRGNGHYF